MKTGYCAANYTQTDDYDAAECGPIRRSSEQAQRDMEANGYEGVRYVHSDGFLYVDKPEAQ